MAERRRRKVGNEEEQPIRRRRHRGPDNNSDIGSTGVQKINIHGSVTDVSESSSVPRRRRREVVSNTDKKKRKSKYPEVDLEQLKVRCSMSQDMCEACKQKDIRMIQDNFNIIFLTMNEVSRELDIDEDDWKKRMKKLREWAKTSQAHKVKSAHKRALDKDIKRAIKKNGGRQ